MRELFEICPKIQGFFQKPFWCFLRFKGGDLIRKGVKYSVLMCQGQKMTIFPHLVPFFNMSL